MLRREWGSKIATTVLRSRFSVAVISGTRVAREGLCSLIEQRDRELSVAHSDGPTDDAITSLSERMVDAVLVDGSCQASLDALWRIHEAVPEAQIVVYGVRPVRDVLLICARDGATVVASNDTDADALVMLLKRAAARELIGEAQLNATLLGELSLSTHGNRGQTELLTRRERQIALALAGGLSNKEIAQRFCISLPTVKTHVHCILRKLGIESRDEVLSRLSDSAAE
jgi:DNA-binding NarL/FixJ family response regulator